MKWIYSLLFISLTFLGCQSSDKKHQHQQEEAEATVSDNCAHCGMPTSSYKQWSSSLVDENSKEHKFCSNKCLMMTIHQMEELSNPTEVSVTDYYTLEKIDGKKAFFVWGSDKVGPMGKGFVAFKTKEDAESFAKDYNGQLPVLSYKDIDTEVVKKAIQ
ncbi:nitrous oxide reductase accessory protein NosL [Algivirga pacifica]|uniref:Nitrous oxide reductase accessory protein NosL n=1 Tax=Algivirga pacifica TaxID=1162670 RepID=A0ABP9DQY5_9BACT